MSITAMKQALEQALEALNNSSDLVEGEYTEAVRRYGGMPSRQGKLAGLSALVGAHRATRTAIQEQLK